MPITEETPNNQEDRMIWPVDITLPLSLATPVLAPQAHEWSGPCDRDGGYAYTQSKGSQSSRII